jgi:PAS domain S-box-containing protein
MLSAHGVEFLLLDAATFRLEEVNPAAMANLGLKRNDVGRMRFEDLLPEYDRAALDDLTAPLLRGDVDEVSLTTFALRRDGSTYDVSYTMRAALGGGRLAVLGRDITERRRVESNLRRRTEELSRLNVDLDNFALMASHDLTAPLQRIAARAEGIAKGEVTPADAAEIAGQATRLQRQIDTLLALARGEASMDMDMESVALDRLLGEILAERSADLDAAGATVELGDLPTVRAAPGPVRLVLDNLIDNALRFRAADRPLTITIAADPAAPSSLVIADNGRGIDETRADDLFQPRARGAEAAGTSNGPDGGLGMGLAIYRQIMRAHGGDVEAHGQIGHGAAFTLRFPAVPR